jgi:hypothetical protein
VISDKATHIPYSFVVRQNVHIRTGGGPGAYQMREKINYVQDNSVKLIRE